MTFNAVVVGATGLVGTHLVNKLIADNNCTQINIIVRKKTNFAHPKIKEHVINFDRDEDYIEHIRGDVLFSCLGSTRSQAGSVEKHYLVDYTYQFKAATSASQNGVQYYVLVSSPFASKQSGNYYRKMKAELEESVVTLGFQKITILKPNGILGKRGGLRNWENMAGAIFTPLIKLIPGLRKYTPIHASDLAISMLKSYYRSTRNNQRITIITRTAVNFGKSNNTLHHNV